MNKRILFGTMIALVVLISMSVSASATEPMAVSGEYWLTEPYANLELRPAGNNCIIEVDAVYPFTGDLSGTAYAHFRVVSHGPCESALPFAHRETLHATGTFEGQVAGRSGSFDFSYEGKGWPAGAGEAALTARITVLTGTEELSNLHGILDVSYIMGNPFDSYSGQIHFDPGP